VGQKSSCVDEKVMYVVFHYSVYPEALDWHCYQHVGIPNPHPFTQSINVCFLKTNKIWRTVL